MPKINRGGQYRSEDIFSPIGHDVLVLVVIYTANVLQSSPLLVSLLQVQTRAITHTLGRLSVLAKPNRQTCSHECCVRFFVFLVLLIDWHIIVFPSV